jgi:hypothetical protein
MRISCGTRRRALASGSELRKPTSFTEADERALTRFPSWTASRCLNGESDPGCHLATADGFEKEDPRRDAAPTEAGAVPGTSLPSDHACILSTCWPRQTWIATSRRGWVIAAWVLECRARFADSSVRTTCDSHLTVTRKKLLEAHSFSTTRLPLESFLPLSGRNGKVF